jgi:hypothetical protein
MTKRIAKKLWTAWVLSSWFEIDDYCDAPIEIKRARRRWLRYRRGHLDPSVTVATVCDTLAP